MKRTVSMLLALLMTVSCFLVLPLSAEESTDAAASVEVANIDFAQMYQDLNLTERTSADSIDNLGIGVAEKGSAKYNKAKAVLTADGLAFSSVNIHAHALTVSTSLAGKTDYTIEAVMKYDASGDSSYLFFGWANDLNGDDAWKIVNGGTNLRFGGGQMQFNGDYAFDSADNATALKTLIKDEKKTAAYQFVVEDGKLAKVIVTCGETSVTYANSGDNQLDTAKGDFTLALRADSDQVLTVTLEKLTVTEKDAASALVEKDYKAIYTEKGLTAETAAAGMADLGVEVIERVPKKYDGKNYRDLTEQGLAVGSYSDHVSALIAENDMSDYSEYVYEYTMALQQGDKTNNYLVYGFGLNATADADPWCFTVRDEGGTYSVLVFRSDDLYSWADFTAIGDTSDKANAKKLNTAIANGEFVTYRFFVKDGKMNTFTVSCGDTEVTYTNYTKGLTVDPKSMILSFRCDGGSTCGAVLKQFRVTGTPKALPAYSNDYAKLYTDLALTEATDATTLDNLGIKLFAVGSGEDDLSYARLTGNGLEMTSVNKKARGFVFNGCDLAGQSSYLIQMTMSFDEVATNCYPFFGYGFNADATDWNVFKDTANRNNIRFNGGSSLVINGFETDDNAAVLWTALYTDHKEATYQFVVTDGKLANILIKCDGELYTFKAKSDCNMSAASGDFIISLRTDGESTTKLTLKSIAVLDADQLLKSDNDTPAEEQLENILTVDRTQPTEPELAYSDTAATKYKAGYVLHYMDFSKVSSFDDTGYFVTNDAEPTAFMIKDGELRVKTNSSDGVKVMLTGNAIPKNIQNFTVQIKFRFVEPSSSYFVFIQSNKIGTDGKTSSQKDTCFRYNGTIDNTTTMVDDATVKAFWEEVRAGKEVTFTYCAMERETYQIVATCGDYTVTWYKGSNTISVSDSFFGFMVGRGTNLAISSVAVIAETPDDYAEKGLIWPGEANALVQNVSADALYVPSSEDNKPNTPSEPVTSEQPKPNATAETPTTGTEKPTDTGTDGTSGSNEETKGCQSSLPGYWIVLAGLAVALAVMIPMNQTKKIRKN